MGATTGNRSVIRPFIVEATKAEGRTRTTFEMTIRASGLIAARAIASRMFPGLDVEVREA